jgi:malonate decarboxylase delta subunit
MTETFTLNFPAANAVVERAHIGVVASGDMELLLEPAASGTQVRVVTMVSGHRKTWEAVLTRFFERHPYAVAIEINDHGATPGLVWLRLEQALELALKESLCP